MFYVYLLASGLNGTLYVGMTRDLLRWVWEHKTWAVPGFTKRYAVDRLVWFEQHDSLEAAYVRERQIKGWKRVWKIHLIEADNPQWIDLFPSLSP
jgi:putative endonuclease